MLENTQVITLISSCDHMLEPDERGASAVEYGLLVALVGAVIAGIVTTVGTDLQAVFQNAVGLFP